MRIIPREMKRKAAQALNGNWQTALLVSFFAGALITGYSLVRVEIRFDPFLPTLRDILRSAEESLYGIPVGTWTLFGVLYLLSFVITPALELGCNHYFICRLKGEELGFYGLFSRMRLWGKAFLLHLLISVKILLWSLLFVIPGVVASFRYSMATYYLAENPSLSPWEALAKSKAVMRTKKWDCFVLQLSFFGWLLLVSAVQLLLTEASVILALVVYQFLALFVNTYANGAFAAFFLTVSAGEQSGAGEPPVT